MADKNSDKSGQSKPDDTSSDNPSDTGKTSVDSQTNGTVKNDDGSVTHTRKYGSDAQTSSQSASNTKGESLDQFAERGVVERHGAAIRDNPNFKQMVADEKAQIEENARNTEGM